MQKEKNVWMCDFETFTDTGRVWLGGAMQLFTRRFYHTTSITNAFNQFHEYFLNQSDPIIYFHNGGKFDIKTYVAWLIENGYEPNNMKTQNDYYFSYLITKNSFFELKIYTKKHIIKCYDSIKLLAQSVKSLGGKSNLIDFRDSSKTDELSKDEISYLKEDCETVCKYLENELFYGGNNKVKMTIGSFVRNIFREKYNLFARNNLINQLTLKEHDEINLSFRGGKVQVNPNYQAKYVKGMYYKYDYNSRYPSIMCDNLPYGHILKNPPKDSYFATLYKVEIYNAILLKGEFPYIGYMDKDNSYKYPKIIKSELYYCWDFELDHIKTIYKIDYKITKSMYFKTKPYLKDFIVDLYSQRLRAKQEKKESLQLILKLMLNNIFGKEGQKRKQECCEFASCYKKNNLYYDSKTNECLHVDKPIYCNKYYLKTITQIENNVFKLGYIPMASFITAKGRISLSELQSEYKENWVYSDTDSIILFNKTLDDKYISSTELGKLKLEGVSEKFYCHAPKKYWFDNDFYFNGLRKSIIENISFEDFMQLKEIENGQSYIEYKNGYPIISHRDFNLISFKRIEVGDFEL